MDFHIMPTGSDISLNGPATSLPPVIGSHQTQGYRPSQLTRTLLLAGMLALGAAGVLYYFLFDPNKFSIFPPCLFHQLTGLDCPGCGAQRAFHQLLHGHLIAAIRLNVMFVFSLPLFAWMGTRFLMRQWNGQPGNLQFKWWSLYFAAWILFGVLRNLPFPVCQWFAA
jgi:hypothetical protein